MPTRPVARLNLRAESALSSFWGENRENTKKHGEVRGNYPAVSAAELKLEVVLSEHKQSRHLETEIQNALEFFGTGG
jgi:hypothetical protein